MTKRERVRWAFWHLERTFSKGVTASGIEAGLLPVTRKKETRPEAAEGDVQRATLSAVNSHAAQNTIASPPTLRAPLTLPPPP